MNHTLITNPGSSSKKYALYEGTRRLGAIRYELIADGVVRCVQIDGEQPHCREEGVEIDSLAATLPAALTLLKERGLITNEQGIGTVGLRVVAPGRTFTRHQPITDAYLKELATATTTAPLHVPVILEEITTTQIALPKATILGLSDSAFHQTIPEIERQYSPRAAREYGIERFGYHGLSVASIAAQLPSMFGTPPARTVVAHIGSGVSVTGLEDGQSRSTTMGYTPASGVLMSSRATDLDPGAVVELLDCENISGAEAHQYLQTEGGFVGFTGTADLRSVLGARSAGSREAAAAYKHFITDIQRAIACATITLGGIDALVLTATAVERNSDLRADIIAGLNPLGLALADEINHSTHSRNGIISHTDSSAPIAIICTDELGMMASLSAQLQA